MKLNTISPKTEYNSNTDQDNVKIPYQSVRHNHNHTHKKTHLCFYIITEVILS